MMTLYLYVIAGLCCTSNRIIHVHIDSRMRKGNRCNTKSSNQMNEGKWHTHTYIYTIFTTPYWLIRVWNYCHVKILRYWLHMPVVTKQLCKSDCSYSNTLAYLAWILDAKFKLNNTHFMSGHSPGPEVATGTAIRWFVRITEFRSKVGARFTRLAHCVGLLAEFNLTR